jgi:hypothetical protein
MRNRRSSARSSPWVQQMQHQGIKLASMEGLQPCVYILCFSVVSCSLSIVGFVLKTSLNIPTIVSLSCLYILCFSVVSCSLSIVGFVLKTSLNIPTIVSMLPLS